MPVFGVIGYLVQFVGLFLKFVELSILSKGSDKPAHISAYFVHCVYETRPVSSFYVGVFSGCGEAFLKPYRRLALKVFVLVYVVKPVSGFLFAVFKYLVKAAQALVDYLLYPVGPFLFAFFLGFLFGPFLIV